jgi:hypothetical protein
MLPRFCHACDLPLIEPVSEPPLPPTGARVLGLITARPGVNADAIASWLYPGNIGDAFDKSRKAVRFHICKINKRLQAAGSALRVRGSRREGYRVINDTS